MTHRSAFWRTAPLLLLSAACTEPRTISGPELDASPNNAANASVGSPPVAQGIFHRYVSIGTSISMGWQSDGAIAATQRESWTAQLARLAGRQQTLPLLAYPGCRSPLRAPLGSGIRLSFEPAGAPQSSLSCAGLEPGVQLPAQNVAISAATTFNALFTTPETQTDPAYTKLYPFMLPPNTSQLQAALQQKPLFISVELGANDIFNARSGLYAPGVTVTPFNVWSAQYDQVVSAVAGEVKHGLLVGLINDAATFPAFRRGAEIWNDAPTMLGAFHVAVNQDCKNSPNLVFVPVLVPTAIGQGARRRALGEEPFPFSCAGVKDTTDFILDPAEAKLVNDQLALMNSYIAAKAAQHGYAYVALQSLYGRSDLKKPFSSIALMTTQQPYGDFISLDGIHPTGKGHAILAAAARDAISAHYGIRFQPPRGLIAN